MKKPKDYAVEDLLNKSEKLVEGLGEVDWIDGVIPEKVEEKIIEDIQAEEMEALQQQLDLETEGYVEIKISEDEMIATADFVPPLDSWKPDELKYIKELLNSKGIIYGIDWDAIKKALFKCNTERVHVTDVIIARGKKPINEIPEHLIVEEKLIKEKPVLDSKALRIDYKELSPFVFVKKGEVLAKLVPKKEGVMGSSVYGKAIPYKIADIHQIKPGKNTHRQKDYVVAARSGRFRVQDDFFWVNEVLEVQKNVDYSTGHINFSGDVIIHGRIEDGFKVNCGGSLVCEKTLNASEVTCKKDLLITLGIIGRKKGTAKVGGIVSAKFLENCYLEAKGSIFIEVGIMNSVVYTLDLVQLGEKGIIVGGKIYAQNGITATQVGTATGARTEIYCGIDYLVQKKLEWIRDMNLELTFKLRQIEGRIAAGGQADKKLLEIQEKTKKAIHKLDAAAKSLIPKLDKNEDAKVIVKGSISPDSYINICNTPYIVHRKMAGVSFRLNRIEGAIVSEKI